MAGYVVGTVSNLPAPVVPDVYARFRGYADTKVGCIMFMDWSPWDLYPATPGPDDTPDTWRAYAGSFWNTPGLHERILQYQHWRFLGTDVIVRSRIPVKARKQSGWATDVSGWSPDRNVPTGFSSQRFYKPMSTEGYFEVDKYGVFNGQPLIGPNDLPGQLFTVGEENFIRSDMRSGQKRFNPLKGWTMRFRYDKCYKGRWLDSAPTISELRERFGFNAMPSYTTITNANAPRDTSRDWLTLNGCRRRFRMSAWGLPLLFADYQGPGDPASVPARKMLPYLGFDVTFRHHFAFRGRRPTATPETAETVAGPFIRLGERIENPFLDLNTNNIPDVEEYMSPSQQVDDAPDEAVFMENADDADES